MHSLCSAVGAGLFGVARGERRLGDGDNEVLLEGEDG